MQQHRRTPEQALIAKEYEEINRLSWKLRKLTGGSLRLGLIMYVPENIREDVKSRVQFLHKKHGVIDNENECD